jgi:hypothetical protein
VNDEQCCDRMRQAVTTDDMPVFYRPQFRSWNIEQQDGLGTRWRIRYCPWSGNDLGDGLSQQWLDEVKRRGLDPTAPEEDLPDDLRDDRWWKTLGL